ncbi:MAG: CPBP family intramembrane metalloprotease [Muribaculaceae bacterium]|nr:CPBP family intramembrane metalloprotease [Muribaculaceae bacterium]
MYKISLTAQLCIFGAVFIIGLIIVGMINGIASGFIEDDRARFLIVSVFQNLLVFCVPALIAAYINGHSAIRTLSLNVIPNCKALLGVVISFAIGFIFFNQIIYWNDNISFPDSLSDIEASLRAMENAARDTSNIIMADSSVIGLLTNILVVGVITGFSEELFFRAGLQRMLSEAMPKLIAIWVAAFIFSTLHFQFFGFVPRLLLGAFFGYLYVWTNSIWVSIFAHALNNSIVVLFEWMIIRGVLSSDFDSIGVAEHGFPILPLISLCLFILFMFTRKMWFNKSHLRKIK